LRGEQVHRRLVAVVGVACLVGLAGGAFVANAAADITSPETISVRYDITKLRYIDVGKSGGSSIGNVLLLAERLTDQSSGAIVGKARVECMTHIGSAETCVGAFDIDGRGQIVAEGLRFTNGEDRGFDLPITGGTDEFANVRGQLRIETGNSYDGSIYFELIP
jgi:hypothetical protein